MELEYIFAFAAFCLCFLTAFIGLKAVSVNLTSFVPDYNWRKDTFLPVYLTISVAFIILFAISKANYDIIFPLHWLELLSALICTGVVYVVSILPKTSRFAIWAFILAVILCSLLLPSEFTLFQNHLPFWADRLLTILLWIAYAWCFRYLNGLDGIATLQASTFTGGLVIIAILGGLPILFGSFAMALLGALLALLFYNWYPAKLLLKDGACTAIGFLLGWMIILSAREGIAPCALVYSMYFIIEILWAVSRRIWNGNGTISTNTTYYLINISGLAPSTVAQNISKLLIVLLVIGSFQVYAPNNYSMPLASALITLWFLTRLLNWQEPTESLKEINLNVIRDVKDNVEDLKKIIK